MLKPNHQVCSAGKHQSCGTQFALYLYCLPQGIRCKVFKLGYTHICSWSLMG